MWTFSKVKHLEAFKHMMFTGSGLERRHLTKQYKESISRHLCKSCAKAKITRRSFQPSGSEASKFLEKVTADISAYLNCPSCEGYKYVVLTDAAIKMIWVFSLKTRTGEEVFVVSVCGWYYLLTLGDISYYTTTLMVVLSL